MPRPLFAAVPLGLFALSLVLLAAAELSSDGKSTGIIVKATAVLKKGNSRPLLAQKFIC